MNYDTRFSRRAEKSVIFSINRYQTAGVVSVLRSLDIIAAYIIQVVWFGKIVCPCKMKYIHKSFTIMIATPGKSEDALRIHAFLNFICFG